MNLCRGCGEDFASLTTFDRHRVGVHTYSYTEGLRMEPLREDGRRCLDMDEMRARGWTLDGRSRWRDSSTPHPFAERRERT